MARQCFHFMARTRHSCYTPLCHSSPACKGSTSCWPGLHRSHKPSASMHTLGQVHKVFCPRKRPSEARNGGTQALPFCHMYNARPTALGDTLLCPRHTASSGQWTTTDDTNAWQPTKSHVNQGCLNYNRSQQKEAPKSSLSIQNVQPWQNTQLTMTSAFISRT
jgi:hypothetical protein